MATAAMQKVLQEVAILALGRGATAAELAALENMAGQNGDYAPLVNLVNEYMGSLAAAQGTAAVVKSVALNGLGMSLSNSQAATLAAAIDSGSLSWANAFVSCINMTDSNGLTLNNRAEAAHGFLADLATASKSAYYSGAAVELAVKNLLQGIGASATSLSNGQSGLDALIANLKATGIQGAVVDGYVKGATVFVDANGDGVQNAGEWSTTTDDNGNYVLPANTAGGKIVASGGTDIMTGKPFQGVLTAPAGSTVINPLTTLVQGMIESGQAASVEDATSAVQQALGLPTDINPLTYDPLAVLADSGASAAAQAAALSVQATALQVANIISQTGAAINAGSSTTTLLSSTNAVIEALAGAMASGTLVKDGNVTLMTISAPSDTGVTTVNYQGDTLTLSNVENFGFYADPGTGGDGQNFSLNLDTWFDGGSHCLYVAGDVSVSPEIITDYNEHSWVSVQDDMRDSTVTGSIGNETLYWQGGDDVFLGGAGSDSIMILNPVPGTEAVTLVKSGTDTLVKYGENVIITIKAADINGYIDVMYKGDTLRTKDVESFNIDTYGQNNDSAPHYSFNLNLADGSVNYSSASINASTDIDAGALLGATVVDSVNIWDRNAHGDTNTFTGSDLSDTFTWEGGNDTFNGSDGADRVSFWDNAYQDLTASAVDGNSFGLTSGATTVATVTQNSGNVTVNWQGYTLTLVGVETLQANGVSVDLTTIFG